MLQINNTGQVYTPGNTGCISIIGGPLSLGAERQRCQWPSRDWDSNSVMPEYPRCAQ